MLNKNLLGKIHLVNFTFIEPPTEHQEQSIFYTGGETEERREARREGRESKFLESCPPQHILTHTRASARAVALRTQDYFYLGGLRAAHVQSGAFSMATSDVTSPRSK